MPIDLGGTAGSVALFFSSFFFSVPPFLIGRLQAENLLDFVQTEKGRAWFQMKCVSPFFPQIAEQLDVFACYWHFRLECSHFTVFGKRKQ